MILNVKKGPVCAGPFLYQENHRFPEKETGENIF